MTRRTLLDAMSMSMSPQNRAFFFVCIFICLLYSELIDGFYDEGIESLKKENETLKQQSAKNQNQSNNSEKSASEIVINSTVATVTATKSQDASDTFIEIDLNSQTEQEQEKQQQQATPVAVPQTAFKQATEKVYEAIQKKQPGFLNTFADIFLTEKDKQAIKRSK